MILTDVDLKLYLDSYNCSYEIKESYFSVYNYLPKQYINFILDKYVLKTQLKNVEGKEVEYAREKGTFNSLYGMAVTNTIRADVEFERFEEWIERPLTDEEISEKLSKDKKRGFLNFAWGVWCTAYARDNLLRRVLELDEYVCYCDTDSCKLVQGYDKSIFDKYNLSVKALTPNATSSLERWFTILIFGSINTFKVARLSISLSESSVTSSLIFGTEEFSPKTNKFLAFL